MESVTDLFPKHVGNTRVWITERGRKEFEKHVNSELRDRFRAAAVKGFKGYQAAALRSEGNGVWAFGPVSTTTRIAFYFHEDIARQNLVVGGVWYGKQGGGNSRPPSAEAIVQRVAELKVQGVEFPNV